MLVGIAHTKTGNDANAVYLAWERCVSAFGDSFVHCYSANDIEAARPDVLIMVSFPQYDNKINRVIPEFPNFIKDYSYKQTPINSFRQSVLETATLLGIRIIFIESGVLKTNRNRDGDKNNYYQVGYDCIKGLGKYYNENVDVDRLNKLNIELQPWREPNKNILMFGQLKFGVGSQHIDIHVWYRQCLAYCKANKIVVSYLEHPNVYPNFVHNKFKIRYPARDKKYDGIGTTLSFSSNACIDAIVAGIPSIAMSTLSPAYEFCTNILEDYPNVKKIDRVDFLKKMAYTQWTINEMENGECWNHLRPYATMSPSARYPIIQRNI